MNNTSSIQKVKRILFLFSIPLIVTLISLIVIASVKRKEVTVNPKEVVNTFLEIIGVFNAPIYIEVETGSWPMAGANPERTSWTTEEVPGNLTPVWYKTIEPYIPQRVQVIAVNDTLFLSTARGLYAFDANTGADKWVYPTELPLGHSPTYYNGILYVGGFDHKIHAINADTGAGIWTFEAEKGFQTNPLVLEDNGSIFIYAGSRDGFMYALRDTGIAGELVWKFQTDGPVLFSAAYNNNTIFFASNDSHAYALNAENGNLVWKSEKLPGAGFHSWWPVIYNNRVIFAGSNNYRTDAGPGERQHFSTIEKKDLYPNSATDPRGTPIGSEGTISGDWIPGTPTIDAQRIVDYLEEKPWRKTLFVLDQTIGEETEIAPFAWTGTHSGNRYPPIIGSDGVLYAQNNYLSDRWIAGGNISGWKFGTSIISRPSGGWIAVDEPQAYSAGGDLIYSALTCDRSSGAINIADYSSTNHSFSYFCNQCGTSELWLTTKATNYNELYWGMDRGWGAQGGTGSAVFGNQNGIYGNHGDQNPPIPYKGKVYIHKSNALLAFDNTTGSSNKLPIAYTQTVQKSSNPVSTDETEQKLEDEITKMIQAGHLRPGFYSTGLFDSRGLNLNSTSINQGISSVYFSNPAETIDTLLRALPYVSPDLQIQLRTYIQNEFQNFPPYQYRSIGWRDGAARELFNTPPEASSNMANLGPSSGMTVYGFYALWKYAEEFGGAETLYNESRNRLPSPPDDSVLQERPYLHNAFIAGYLGYLELEKLAGQSETSSVRDTYDQLLLKRITFFDKDSPYPDENLLYIRDLNVARNFMYLVPELGEYMQANILTEIEEAVTEYEEIAPYWFVSKFEATFREGTLSPLYNYHALFQAKAYILQQSQEELEKYLDVPGFYRGDLFYIQNLVALIEAESDGTPEPPPPEDEPPQISSFTTNESEYSESQIPMYEKMEITFSVSSDVDNFNPFFPYISESEKNTIGGLEQGYNGISVQANFTDPNGIKITQPAFYYQEFEDQVKGNNDWIHPTENYFWKVRFSPHKIGQWNYTLSAQDTYGTTVSQTYTFMVSDSDNKGFIRVSKNDPRYFEYNDGTYFPALGYNLNYRRIDWINPTISNQTTFQAMSQNGIQLIRMWLSQWSIFSSHENPWRTHTNFSWSYLSNTETYDDSEFSLKVSGNGSRCILNNWESAAPAVERNSDYRIKVRYKLTDLPETGLDQYLIDPTEPYGFVIKTGGWLWGTDKECYRPGTGTVLSEHISENTDNWQELEGTIHIGEQDYLPRLYFALENLTTGNTYIDHIWVQKNLGNGQYGPNIIYKPDMDHHKYFDQRNSYSFDKVIELAEQYDIYLRPVILEKNEWIMNHIDLDGNFTPDGTNNNFYGDWRNLTKIRWLQQAWWRYLQARWGYSPSIHSWELLNEGDPFHGGHYTLTDEFGKYMKCGAFDETVDSENGSECLFDHPNHHLVSTSTWHSFPQEGFWSNQNYANIDFADIHKYPQENQNGTYRINDNTYTIHDSSAFYDAALLTESYSKMMGAKEQYGANKPIIRGEIGFSFADTDHFNQNASNGVWLHNLIWGGINSGGLIESYWIGAPTQDHIYKNGSHNHRSEFKPYYNFIKDIPLNNGNYEDLAVSSNNNDIRIFGQIDTNLSNAHLWIQNKNYTWKNVSDIGESEIQDISGTVTLSEFLNNQSYTIEYWDTNEVQVANQIIKEEIVSSNSSGEIILTIENLHDDIALKIAKSDGVSTPLADFIANVTSGPAPLSVSFTDQSSGNPSSWMWDFDNDGTVDSTQQNPLFEYTQRGTYSVSLTVSNGTDESTELKTDFISVLHKRTDCNKDDAIDTLDMQFSIMYYGQIDPSIGSDFQSPDINEDGTVTTLDIAHILKDMI